MKFLSVWKESHALLVMGITFLIAGAMSLDQVTEWLEIVMCIFVILISLYILYAAYKQACKETEVKK
ncbi:hypothetical protein SDC9_42695 [bioreactor metagenome]|uniref:Uncharacterized protein n=1 Tax=bioreactor metagenome TaxID=1076179 RepID=A0A644W201_9ZZZZ